MNVLHWTKIQEPSVGIHKTSSAMHGLCNRRLIFYLLLNIVCSNAALIILRILCSEFGLPPFTLTCFSCFMTSLGLLFCDRMKVFRPKPLPVLPLLPPLIIYCGYLGLNQLSLQKNLIGSHTVIKSLTPLLVMAIQTYIHKWTFTKNVRVASIAVSAGIILSNVYEIGFDGTGLLLAVAGFIMAALFYLWVSEYSSKLQATLLQVLFYLMPMSALCLLIVVPFVEPVDRLFDILEAVPYRVYAMVGVTSVLCFILNITTYWILQETSALTYSMIVNIKICTLYLFGLVVYLVNSKFLEVSQVKLVLADILPVLDKGPGFLGILGLAVTIAGLAVFFNTKRKERYTTGFPLKEPVTQASI